MNITREPDWSHWRSFEAVVTHGSLSAAARHLGLSQPTLGRHIENLEQQLGIGLFERSLKGLRPTEAALHLFEPVVRARNELAEACNRAEGRTEVLQGSVRVTASVIFSHYVLPPMLKRLRNLHPAIALEIVATDANENLLLREADIAIRMVRPNQLDLITRHLGNLEIACCAHRSYLEKRSAPQHVTDLLAHDLIGFDRSELLIRGARELGFNMSRSDFIMRTDSQTLIWELLKQGLGVGFAQANLVDDTQGMVRLQHGLDLPALEVWLTSHRELFTSRRIRAIYDALAQDIAAYVARAAGLNRET